MLSNLTFNEGKAPAIYVHVPFCVSKCAYCDFYSLPCKRARNDGTEKSGRTEEFEDSFSEDIYSLQERYADALIRQMRSVSEKYNRPSVSTVFIGGGTPSVLKTEYTEKLIKGLYEYFDIPKDAEFTVEVNPETVDRKKLSLYKSLGVSRISIGMQSAVDSELKAISRIHDFKAVQRAVENARAAGIDNINLDVMYALPGQTSESFKKTLDAVLSLSPEHISVYGLQLEEGTPLFNNREKLIFPGEDGENEMNALALNILEKNGYGRYEISNYAKQGFECKHNLTYWTLGEYFGLGAAAHSFKDGIRSSIKKDINAYCNSTDFADVTEDEEILTKESFVEEFIMLSLRLCRGLSLSKLRLVAENAEDYLQKAEPFIKGSFMELYSENGETFLRFTPKGFNVSNTVLSELLCF